MATWSVIIAATVEADDQDAAESALLTLLPWENVYAVDAILLRATVHDDRGIQAHELNQSA